MHLVDRRREFSVHGADVGKEGVYGSPDMFGELLEGSPEFLIHFVYLNPLAFNPLEKFAELGKRGLQKPLLAAKSRFRCVEDAGGTFGGLAGAVYDDLGGAFRALRKSGHRALDPLDAAPDRSGCRLEISRRVGYCL